MKILKIILLSMFVLIIVSLIAIYIFLATFNVDKYRPMIIEQAQKALGREVNIGHIALQISLSKGLALAVNEVSLKDSPLFFDGNLFQVQSIKMDVNVALLLTTHQIVIGKVEIIKPEIVIVRNKDGQINLLALSPQANSSKGSENQEANKPTSPNTANGQSVSELPQFLVQTVVLREAKVRYVDKGNEPAIDIPIEPIDIEISDISLTKDFPIKAEVGLWSDKKNIIANGRIKIDLAKGEVQVFDLTATSKLESIDQKKLVKSIPALTTIPITWSMKGEIWTRIASLTAGSKGLIALKADGNLTQGQFYIKDFNYSFDNIVANFNADEARVNLTNLTADFSGGRISAQGELIDYLVSRDFKAKAELNNIRIEKLVEPFKLPIEIEGGVFLTQTINGSMLDPNKILSSLSGMGNIDLKETKILKINVLKELINKLSMIPGVEERLLKSLPSNYQDLLSKDETPIKKFRIITDLKESKVDLKEINLETEGFRVLSQGSLTFQQNIKLDSQFYITKDLAQAMISGVEEFGYLATQDQEILIPLTSYDGPIQKIRIFPDMKYLGEKIIKNKGKDEIEKAIFKALKIENKADSPENGNNPASTDQNQTPDEEKHPEKVIIRSILDAIIK